MNRFDELADRVRSWKPPAELSTPGPREVEMTGYAIALVVLAIVFVAAGIAAGIFIWKQGVDRSSFQGRLQADGVTAEATITRLYRGRGDSSDRFVAYQFQFDGSIYRANTRAPRRIWNELKEGQTLTVRFVPADPSRSRPTGWDSSGPPPWIGFVAAAFLFAPATIFMLLLKNARRLLEEGRPAPAMVVKHSKAKHGQAVHYEFPLLNGGIMTGQSDPEQKPPGMGEIICIIYDRDNPKRHARYPINLYRVRDASTSGRARL